MQVLANGCTARLTTEPVEPVTIEALISMRLNASWSTSPSSAPTAGLPGADLQPAPGLAVVVCTGPSSVAQRVRGLRLGVDAWITSPVTRGADLRDRGGAPPSPASELPELDAPTTVGELTIRPDLHQAYVAR